MHAHHMQEKQLLLKQNNVWSAFIAGQGNIAKHITGEYDILEGSTSPGTELDEPGDTSIYYSNKSKQLPFKVLTTNLQWNSKRYHVLTYVSSTEFSHMVIKAFLTEAVIFALLLRAIIILNRRSSGTLWRPFFSTMKEVKEYDI